MLGRRATEYQTHFRICSVATPRVPIVQFAIALCPLGIASDRRLPGILLRKIVQGRLRQVIHEVGYTFRKAAVKVVLLFGDAPPRQDGLEKAMMLARKFSLQPNSFVSTVSVRSMQPIPEFFHIAAAGGGESMILGNGNILQELLLLIFRQAHREEAARLLNLQR